MLTYYFLCFVLCCCSLEMQFFRSSCLMKLKFISYFSPKILFLNFKNWPNSPYFMLKRSFYQYSLWKSKNLVNFGSCPITSICQLRKRKEMEGITPRLVLIFFKFLKNICTVWDSIKDNHLAWAPSHSLFFSSLNYSFHSLKFCI